eukprot:2756260-Amphidinium_carterae.1
MRSIFCLDCTEHTCGCTTPRPVLVAQPMVAARPRSSSLPPTVHYFTQNHQRMRTMGQDGSLFC